RSASTAPPHRRARRPGSPPEAGPSLRAPPRSSASDAGSSGRGRGGSWGRRWRHLPFTTTLWYNGTILRYLRTLGLAAALVAVTACATSSSSPAASSPTKIRIGSIGGILVFAFGSVWTTDLGLNRLIRIDPGSAAVSGKIRLGQRPYGLAAGAGSMWAASQQANTVARVNPQTLKVTKRIR